VKALKKIEQLSTIKKEIESHVGEKVMLKDIGGRRKVFIKDGIIENTYSSIFVVRLNDSHRRISYSYSDVLTKTVQLEYSVS